MPRLSIFMKQRIIFHHELGFNIKEIVDKLKDEDQFTVSRDGVGLFLKRYKYFQTILNFKSSGRPRKITHLQELELINYVSENPEVSLAEIKEKFNNEISESTISRILKRHDKISIKTRYCQNVSIINAEKRFAFSLLSVYFNENFDNVIFTDESTVKIELYANRRWISRYDRSKWGKFKHPLKVHVWGGISRNGPTDICIFTGTLESIGFQKIVDEYLIPFGDTAFPYGYRLHMDNDPKHASKSTNKFLVDRKINHWITPAQSPDLNPIEMVWAYMKWYLRKKVKPKNLNILVQGILEFWKSKLTKQLCNRYIDHLYKVLPILIENNGKASGH